MSVEKTARLIVHSWNTQCGGCGYGGESWTSSPAKEGKPILVPEMIGEECPECHAMFDECVTDWGTPYEEDPIVVGDDPIECIKRGEADVADLINPSIS